MNALSGRLGLRNDRLFYSGMAALAAVIVVAGFGPTYFFAPFAAVPPLRTPMVHVHGVLFSAWIALFVAQTALIANARVDWHMRMGLVGAVLASAMVVVGLAVSIDQVAVGITPVPGLTPQAFLIIPLGDILMFGALVAAAVWFRRDSQTHKRLMLIATLSILPPALARLPLGDVQGPPFFYGVADLLIASGALYDWLSRGRVHPAYLWAGGAVVLFQLVRLAIAGSGAWMAVAVWLTT